MKSWFEIQFILRSEEAKASLPVKKKTSRQLEAGRVTIQCVRLNDDDFWQSQNRFCFVVKICCHQENDSYYSVIQPRRSGSSGKTCLHRTHVHEVLFCFLFFYNQLWYGLIPQKVSKRWESNFFGGTCITGVALTRWLQAVYSATQLPQFLTASCTMVCCRAKSEHSSLFCLEEEAEYWAACQEKSIRSSEEVLRPQEYNTLRLRGFTPWMQILLMEIIFRNPTF